MISKDEVSPFALHDENHQGRRQKLYSFEISNKLLGWDGKMLRVAQKRLFGNSDKDG
jgi:hypothetical protein